MLQDNELLEFIFKNAEMGKDSLSHVLEKVEDAELRKTLEDQLRDYQDVYNEADELIKARGAEPESAGAAAKTMAHMTADFKLLADGSPSQISGMVIEGNNTGVTKLTQKLNEYGGESREIVSLAHRHLKNMEQNAEDLRPFL